MTDRINLQNTPDSDSVQRQNVCFSHATGGTELRGILFTPKNATGALPGVVVTGAWTSVMDQMAGTYARSLAEAGYAALAFDFAGWGQSASIDGQPRFREDPVQKTADIEAAFAFLKGHPEVDGSRLAGLGICASAGYMAAAVAATPEVGRIALVAPWLHDPAMAEAIYGGPESAANLIEAGRNAEGQDNATLIAASSTDKSSLMFQAPYYTEEDRGLIDAYDNRFHLSSWEPWLSYDAQASAKRLKAPLLVVCSEAAALPAGAHAYLKATAAPNTELWLDDVNQFDFYDRSDVVAEATAAVAAHFASEAQ